MRLPDKYIEQMKGILREEFDAFMQSHKQPPYTGLRVNTLKIAVEDFVKICPFIDERVPWTSDGFYYGVTRLQEGEAAEPGKHPYYHAGLYYIQEPSAMFPATLLDVAPGDIVLDLCAAPGGKSVQIADYLNAKGMLVSNEINFKRSNALVKNIEQCGITNAIVTNEPPKNLSEKFKCFFDKILVDAPCSGEGMFRKDFSAVSSWAKFDNSNYASLQQSIISYAAEMLKPGGLLVYSTCTFNTAENEEVIDEFLNNNPHFELANIDKHYAVSDGFSICSAENGDGKTFKNNTSNCARLWPHKLMGEGHFAALLRKKDGKECDKLSDKYTDTAASTDCDAFFDFLSKYINCSKQEFISKFESGRLTNRNGNIYIDPIVIDFPTNFKVAKIGLYLGTIKNNIFEPSHSMAMALKMKDFNNVINFNANSAEVIKYLKGETLIIDKPGKGYHVVCVDGYPLGWGKLQDGILKNLYPKGWRKMR